MKKKLFKISLSLFFVFFVFSIFLTNYYSFAQNPTKIAKAIIPNAGVISSSWEGKSKGSVLIFEEDHISRIGQIEIALMLTRLYNRYHIKTIALEGAFVTDGILERKWFHKLSDKYAREEVALQLLREGEINAAECIALAIPEVKVNGVEKEEEHTFEFSRLYEISHTLYLFAIAKELFPKDEKKIAEANKLTEELEKAPDDEKPAKLEKLIDYMINSNQWTKEQYKKLKNESIIISIEEMLVILKEIKAKAEKVNADVGEYKNNFNKLIEFYERASKRTDTIITNTLNLYNKLKGVPLPLITGAAHTAKITEILKKKKISHVVIKPIALAEGKNRAELAKDAFERKQKKLSVDDKDLIGSFLDGRWKPSPVLDQVWIRSKSELYYISVLLAHAVKKGDRPPFNSLRSEFASLGYINIDRESFRIIRNNVIFRVRAQTNRPDREETFWGLAAVIASVDRKPLEERLREILDDARDKGIKVEKKTGVKLVKTSLDTIAAFSRSLDTINRLAREG